MTIASTISFNCRNWLVGIEVLSSLVQAR
jgi:hypothetical protein